VLTQSWRHPGRPAGAPGRLPLIDRVESGPGPVSGAPGRGPTRAL